MPKKAILTPGEERKRLEFMEFYNDIGIKGEQREQAIWRDLYCVSPRLREFDGYEIGRTPQ